MPEEIREAGYQTIRDYIDSGIDVPDGWDYIELRDGQDEQVTRVSITDDDRAGWEHSPGMDQTLEVRVEVEGGDDDIPTPTTFAASALYNEESGGDELAWDSFSSATLEQDADTLVVVHEVHVPQE